MQRDLLLFVRHTDAHIVEELKKSHPEWITNEGFCPKCLAHYKGAMRGEKVVANIAGTEVTKRRWMAGISLAVWAALFFFLVSTGASRVYRTFLFVPLFAMSLGFFQAKNRHCVVLGMKGVRHMADGERAITDKAEKLRLQKISARILFMSWLVSVLLATAGYFLL